MTRQAKWKKRARVALIRELGGYCNLCGETCLKKLEFDHINPATRRWQCCREGSYKRMLLYRIEHKLGLLQLLCRRCNARKGNRRKQLRWI